MNFVKEVIDSTKELETPISFYYWASLAIISAVLKDNVWLDRGGVYNLYPNIYVMFHADSGLKKGPPINLAKELVKKVNNTRIISGRSSIQGILKKLGTAYTIPGGTVIKKSTAFIASSELTSSLVEDKAAATILTDLYDRHYNAGDWESLLKMETFQLTDPTITMLTATNEAHSDQFFIKQDIMGGYFARTFIIYEKEENVSNSLVIPPKKTPDKEALIEFLKVASTLRGPYVPLGNSFGEMSKAGKIYNDWYNDFKKVIKEQKIKDDTGTLNRFGDSVLKVAMLLAVSNGGQLEIGPNHMEEAIEVSEKLIGNIRKATMGKRGKSADADRKALIIEELLYRDNHMISRTILMKKYWMHFNASELDEIMLSFDQSGMIRTEVQGNVIVYRMPDAEVEKMLDFLKGKRGE